MVVRWIFLPEDALSLPVDRDTTLTVVFAAGGLEDAALGTAHDRLEPILEDRFVNDRAYAGSSGSASPASC